MQYKISELSFKPIKPSGSFVYLQVYNAKILRSADTGFLFVLSGSQIKQLLFTYSPVTDLFL
jgi:hypothetical protein